MNAEQPSLSGMNFVKSLIEARKAKGLSEEDVANELRISQSVLKEIESNHYSSGQMSVYIKGYIRAYAKLVGVSSEAVDEHFQELGVLDKPAAAPVHRFKYQDPNKARKPMRWLTLFIVFVFLVLVIIWVEWERAGDNAGLPSQAGTTSATLNSNVPPSPLADKTGQ